jgi:hypothetical protein
MRIKKIDLMEIVNSDGELIGNDAIPHNGSDLESQANNTTDYNRTISTQPLGMTSWAEWDLGLCHTWKKVKKMIT